MTRFYQATERVELSTNDVNSARLVITFMLLTANKRFGNLWKSYCHSTANRKGESMSK